MEYETKNVLKNFVKCFVLALVTTVIFVIMDQEGAGRGLRGCPTVPHSEGEFPWVFVMYFIINFIVAIPLTKWLHLR